MDKVFKKCRKLHFSNQYPYLLSFCIFILTSKSPDFFLCSHRIGTIVSTFLFYGISSNHIVLPPLKQIIINAKMVNSIDVSSRVLCETKTHNNQ